ncbi:hypothetical protein E2C01_067055 [Portunus trituberculatus]|uniref:Uncharacterized protein n=1 Tax=Portunus trituberculatus TaxID=210409 RepID=A0A5B7HN48_PORTR|nr:hypothetical protein [Portunus trituberculatus]
MYQLLQGYVCVGVRAPSVRMIRVHSAGLMESADAWSRWPLTTTALHDGPTLQTTAASVSFLPKVMLHPGYMHYMCKVQYTDVPIRYGF